MNNDTFWLAIALVLLIEGLMPFVAPAIWRKTFKQILQLGDGQLRFIGLLSLLCGLALLWWLS